MRVSRLVLSLVFALSFLISSAAQTSNQSAALLQQALAAISRTAINDVTLSGSAHYIAGSTDETGTATLTAILGASRMELNLSGGPRREVVNIVAQPAGTWSGPDGVSHAVAYHNLFLSDPAWFFPAFTISRGLGNGYLAAYIGHETRDAQAVEHLSISQVPVFQAPEGAPTLAHLSQMDLFLDSTTLLPSAITFNTHPDNNAGFDIPITIQFSDYRVVSGVQIPFHVEKYFNNSLILDLQFQAATINSGLPATAFAVAQ